jgi:hypothetical protein
VPEEDIGDTEEVLKLLEEGETLDTENVYEEAESGDEENGEEDVEVDEDDDEDGEIELEDFPEFDDEDEDEDERDEFDGEEEEEEEIEGNETKEGEDEEEEEEEGEEEEAESVKKVVTKDLINMWVTKIQKENDLGASKKLLMAFFKAVHYYDTNNVSDKEKEILARMPYQIKSHAIYLRVIMAGTKFPIILCNKLLERKSEKFQFFIFNF